MRSSFPLADHLRVGVIGCGEIAQTRHLPALQKVNGCVVVAAADVDTARLQAAVRQFGIARQYQNYQELLQQSDVDVVAICTPPAWHTEIALAAMRASKHTFIEKPLALSLEECDALAAEAKQSNVKIWVGFNLRCHRLVLQAREWIRAGRLGTVTALHSTFSQQTRRRFRPGWRAVDFSGSLIWEVSVHHLDLWRFLLGTEIEQVTAARSTSREDDESLVMTARLANGALATGLFAEGTSERNALELYGTKGRLSISLYRFDGLEFTPAKAYEGSLGYRAKGGLRALTTIPGGLVQMARGGDYARSYEEEWRRFVDAIRNDKQVESELADGIAATRAALAASESLAKGSTSDVLQVQTESANTLPALSAIVAIQDQYKAVRRTMRHLQRQTWADRIEIVFIVARNRSPNIDPNDLKPFHSWRVVPIESIDALATAYAAGARNASAPVVVWTEDHCFPQPNWAETFITAHQMPVAVVGPAMRNGNPTSLASWADFYAAYGQWAEPVSSGLVDHLPGHNSSYKRDLLLEYGERLEEMIQAESLLHWDLRARNYSLYLTNQTTNAHLNYATWGMVLSGHFYTGRQFAGLRASKFSRARRVLFVLASPLIPLVRFSRVQRHVRRGNFSRGKKGAILAALLLGFAADGLGEMVGYAFGVGNAHIKRGEHEFNRIEFLTPKHAGGVPEPDV